MRQFRSGVIIAACLALSAPAMAEPGERWQIRSEMSMGGMTMPGQDTTSCMPKDASAEDVPAAAPDGQDCQISNMRTSGATTRYDIRCTGDEPVTGTVETTFHGKDSYTSTMTMEMDGDRMVMKTTARKLGGTCDAGAIRRQAAAAQDAATGQIAQACAEGVTKMQVVLFDGSMPTLQCPAQDKARFCQRLKTEEGYALVAAERDGGRSLDSAARVCDVSGQALRADLCRGALDRTSVDFLRANCPAEAQVLAQRVCAGRSFTSVDARYRGFCLETMRGGSAQAPAPAPAGGAQPTFMERTGDRAADRAADAATDAVIDGGARVLRGLFGN